MKPALDNVRAPGGGRIGLVACPGISGAIAATGAGAALETDLAGIREWGATALVSLTEEFELRLLGVPDLGARARAHGLEWWHLPVVDGAAPGSGFEAAWARAGAALHARLDASERIVLHCQAGLGRSGEVAARLLSERGLTAADAIRSVRRARPGAIQTPEQERWVLRTAPDTPGAGT